jgi:hypothetical protein
MRGAPVPAEGLAEKEPAVTGDGAQHIDGHH